MKSKLVLGIVGGLAAMVVAGFSFTGSAHADTSVTICAASPVGQMQNCEYSRTHGIASIFITNVAEDGTQVIVWNEVYDCESPILVSYLRVGPTGFFEIEECDPPVGVGGGDNGSFTTLPPPSVTPVVQLDLAIDVQPSQAGIYSPCYVDYRKCTLTAYECEHLGQNCPPPSSAPKLDIPVKKIAR